MAVPCDTGIRWHATRSVSDGSYGRITDQFTSLQYHFPDSCGCSILGDGKSTQVLEVPTPMSIILRKSLTIVPVTMLFSLACWGQVSVFEGNVKAVDGKPLPNAVIKIERQDIKGSYKTKTDKKGHYFYGGLPLGVYNVTVEVDGSDRITKPARTQVGQSVDISFDLATAGQGAQG